MDSTGSTPVQRWQHRLDESFPGGVMAFELPLQETESSAPIIWLRVVRMEGLDPVLNMYAGTVVLAERVLTSWQVEGTEFGTTRVRATFAPPHSDYEFVTPPEPLGTRLAAARKRLQADWEAAE